MSTATLIAPETVVRPSTAKPRLRGHIPALDGLRGVAILGVLLFKATEGFHPASPIGAALAKMFGVGWMGVDLFFVLSGFLITGILLDTKAGSHFFKNFYARRTLRIFPLYYGVLFVTFVLVPHAWRTGSPGMERIVDNQGWLWTYLTNIAFLVKRAVFFDAGWMRFNHFWSLAIEEQFYLFWPLLIFLLSRRNLVIACWAIVAGALTMRLGLYAMHQPAGAMFYPTPCRMDGLAIGALIALGVRGERGLTGMLPLAKTGALIFAAALLGVFVWRGQLDVNDTPSLTFGFTIVAAFSACLLILCLDPSPANRWRRFLEAGTLRLFGKFSYGIYVLHMLVIWALDRHWPIDRVAAWCGFEPIGMLIYTALLIAATTAAAFLSWHLFEKQFLKAKSHFSYGT